MTLALRIGEVAEQGGVNLQTIRYYERERLLPEAPRLASGYRMFTTDTVRRVRFIKRAQELGFSLAEIRELLSLRVDDKRSSSEVRDLALAKIAYIDSKIKALGAMKAALTHLTGKCSGSCPARECPILEGLDSADIRQ